MGFLSKILIAVGLFAGVAVGQPPAVVQPDPVQLVRATVANEIRENARTTEFWMYRLTKETKSGTQVRDMVETKDGIVARVIRVNGRPLTDAERAADDRRLDLLARNPQEQARKRADQQKDANRFLTLIRALPEALIYTYDGTEQIEGRQAVRLKFRPNPAFHRTTIETIIFRSAEGFIWIDSSERRILKFEGSETNEISIGWGLLGHIDKGSRLRLEQHRIDESKWRLSGLKLEGSGQILLFKSVTMNQRQSATDFRAVPSGLNVAQAIDLLKKQDATIAQTQLH